MPIRARFSRIRFPGLLIFLAAALATSAHNADAGIPVLPNGDSVSGVIVTTGQDSYEFTATVGDHIELRMADTGATLFAPRIELRSPSDVFIDSSADAVVASIAAHAKSSADNNKFSHVEVFAVAGHQPCRP